MTGQAGRLRVSVIAGSDADDAPTEIDRPSIGDVVEPAGRGAVLVRGQDGTTRRAWVGEVRRQPSGATRVEVVVDGWRFELDVEDAQRADLRRRATSGRGAQVSSEPAEIRAIIPGRIASVRVTVGDAVEAGQTLLVVEAMKMQNELRATRAGTVERVLVGSGQTIDLGDVLVVVR
jgi:biotin carboxyl carrier protein